MSITVVTPEDWHLAPPAGKRGRHLSMMINRENPNLRLLESVPNCFTAPHSHDVSEVMIVLDGRMLFNGQWCGPGTIVYVPANEDYWFSTGDEHCVVALMRPEHQGKHQPALEAMAEA